MNDTDFRIEKVSWQSHARDLEAIRTRVFIEEQSVPVELEWDEDDKNCVHMLVYTKTGKPVATGRMLNSGQIGRMAVLQKYRHQGIGKLILRTLLIEAEKTGLKKVFLNAQINAVDFYTSFGFNETGSRFNDAGIQHIRMMKTL